MFVHEQFVEFARKAARIIAYCKGRIAGYKAPKVVHIVPDLPRNAAGKVLKRELRERYAPAGALGGSAGGQERRGEKAVAGAAPV